jgi:hypothetical protein
MAAATSVTRILDDKVSFTDNTYDYRGYKAHRFNNFVEAAREAGFQDFTEAFIMSRQFKQGSLWGKKSLKYSGQAHFQN